MLKDTLSPRSNTFEIVEEDPHEQIELLKNQNIKYKMLVNFFLNQSFKERRYDLLTASE